MANVTQSDIAKKLNVTRITVSKALRNHSDISKEMKHKVRQVAEELGYIPNLIAKNLSSRKTCTVGVVVPDLENSFFAYVVDTMIDRFKEKNYNMILTVSRESASNESKNIENLIGMRVDGLLICISKDTTDSAIFKKVLNMDIPLVFFDRQFEGLPCSSVSFDDKNDAVEALNEIIDEGYTKIAHFAGYSKISIGKTRLEGYKTALQKKGLKINPDWIIEGGFEVKDGYDSFMKLFRLKKLPEVIFTVTDRVALGVYKAAKEVGVKIPDDLGVLAFGFEETAQAFTPSLTIINQDPRKIGNIASSLLLEKLNKSKVIKTKGVFVKESLLWNNSIIKLNK